MTKSLKKKTEILIETREWIWVRRSSDKTNDPFMDGQIEAIVLAAEMSNAPADEKLCEITVPPRE